MELDFSGASELFCQHKYRPKLYPLMFTTGPSQIRHSKITPGVRDISILQLCSVIHTEEKLQNHIASSKWTGNTFAVPIALCNFNQQTCVYVDLAPAISAPCSTGIS